jgi:hypothetical protein
MFGVGMDPPGWMLKSLQPTSSESRKTTLGLAAGVSAAFAEGSETITSALSKEKQNFFMRVRWVGDETSTAGSI